ncbi:hypothetical protein HNQ88_000132 [Aureibacter tunicatorum]|uniref:Uncharacterized protein n=1 Tax=Aureibacter tunicatorum TaxID=866807 RepID=A0AAE3XGG2_9BACT|nr:hypothetical protein [Aureibacter tunicatorum]BDD06148.1 hypothetical protein AUTU_36310 [Aureibacter tunicatorum]
MIKIISRVAGWIVSAFGKDRTKYDLLEYFNNESFFEVHF